MTLEIDQDKCLKDGICVAECPSRLIEMKTSESFPSPTPEVDAYCLQCGHKAYGAIMVGYPKFKYRRIPLRNPPRVTCK